MTPSAASISGPNFVLNTAVAEILEGFADRLEKATDVQAEVMTIIKETVKDHKRIIFNGNGYSDEWVEEAERRGLPNLTNTVEAAKEMIKEKNMAVLEKHGVLTREESESRYEITLENYSKTINIEALTSIEMVRRQILPVAVDYATNLAASINEIKATGIEVNTSVQGELLVSVSNLASSIKEKVDALEEAVKKAEVIEDSYEMASAYRNDVFVKMNELREDVDTLETEVDSEIWPLPTYSELLFNI